MTKKTLVGAHVSASGGLQNAPLNAAKLGLDCCQFFSRPPQGGRVAPVSKEQASLFQKSCEQAGISQCFIHAPYIINLASSEERIRRNSIEIIRTELERADALGVQAMMTHIGSATGVGEERGLELAIAGVREIAAAYDGPVKFLLEISAGAGMVIGDTFEEIGAIIKAVGDERLAVCFDTAHAFASGYDLRDATAVAETVKKFDKAIGTEKLFMSHVNDSKVELGTRKDRHEHIGQGHIGTAGFMAILASPAFAGKPLILETPDDEHRLSDVDLLKKWRDS